MVGVRPVRDAPAEVGWAFEPISRHFRGTCCRRGRRFRPRLRLGRWAALVAPRVGRLHCIDPAPRPARRLPAPAGGSANVEFHLACVGRHSACPTAARTSAIRSASSTISPTPRGRMADAVRKLKPGAPFLVYLYYDFENRPAWFRWLWRASELGRAAICAASRFVAQGADHGNRGDRLLAAQPGCAPARKGRHGRLQHALVGLSPPRLLQPSDRRPRPLRNPARAAILAGQIRRDDGGCRARGYCFQRSSTFLGRVRPARREQGLRAPQRRGAAEILGIERRIMPGPLRPRPRRWISSVIATAPRSAGGVGRSAGSTMQRFPRPHIAGDFTDRRRHRD